MGLASHPREGRLRPLVSHRLPLERTVAAICSWASRNGTPSRTSPSAALPDLPTLDEAGLKAQLTLAG